MKKCASIERVREIWINEYDTWIGDVHLAEEEAATALALVLSDEAAPSYVHTIHRKRDGTYEEIDLSAIIAKTEGRE